MFQGESRRNNPQAKELTTVPRAAWRQGVVLYGVSRKPGHLLEYWDLAPACGALQDRTEYFPS